MSYASTCVLPVRLSYKFCLSSLHYNKVSLITRYLPSPSGEMARPSHLLLLLLTLAMLHSSQGHAKTFTRCQLSRELLRYNFPRSLIAHCKFSNAPETVWTSCKQVIYIDNSMGATVWTLSLATRQRQMARQWQTATARSNCRSMSNLVAFVNRNRHHTKQYSCCLPLHFAVCRLSHVALKRTERDFKMLCGY